MERFLEWFLIFLSAILFWQLINLFPLEAKFFLLENNKPSTTTNLSFQKKINLDSNSSQHLEENILLRFKAFSKQTVKEKDLVSPLIKKDKETPLIKGVGGFSKKEPIKTNKQNLVIEITALSGIIFDLETEKILWQKDFQKKRNIASLTKLISALVFLETNPDRKKKITLIKEDEIGGARLNVNFKEQIIIKDLFYAGLIGSKNNAILALVRSTGLTKKNFIKKMNEKAQKMELKNTHFVDPTGLNPDNLSTAYDVAKLAKEVFKNEELKKVLILDKYNFNTFLNSKKTREITVKNTNELLKNSFDWKIKAGKTGFSNEAGSCLVIQAEDKKGNEIIAVLLGNETKGINFKEMGKIIDWTFQNYKWTEKSAYNL